MSHAISNVNVRDADCVMQLVLKIDVQVISLERVFLCEVCFQKLKGRIKRGYRAFHNHRNIGLVPLTFARVASIDYLH